MPTPVPALRGSSKNPVSALETTSHLDPPETRSSMDPDESTRKYMSIGARCPSRTCALHTALSPPSPVGEPPIDTARSGEPPVALPPRDVFDEPLAGPAPADALVEPPSVSASP